MNHLAVNVGEPEIAAGIIERQLRVVESEQVQQRGMPVVDMDRLVDGLVTDLVRGAVGQSAFCAPPGHPDRVALVVMVAPGPSLDVGRPTKFSRPHNERLVQKAALLEVGQQPATGWSVIAALSDSFSLSWK